MDEATKRQRARNKLAMGKRGTMPEYESRGMGRKNKPTETFPAQQCSHWNKKALPGMTNSKGDPIWQRSRCLRTAVGSKEVASRFGGKTRRAFCAEHSPLYK